MNTQPTPHAAPQAHATAQAGVPAAPQAAPVPSEDLLRGQRVLEITHNGSVYRLQATRLGKLILTK